MANPNRGRLSRSFWLLWSAFTGANLADGVVLVIVPLLAIRLTDSALEVALVTTCQVLPFVIVGLPIGVVLDRSDRRRAAVWALLGRGATIAALALAVATDAATIGVLMAAAFVLGVGEVVTDGGLPALVQDLVDPDNLEVANSRIAATQTVTNLFIGPPLGATLFAVSPGLSLTVAAGLFVVPAGILRLLPGSFRPTRAAPSSEAGDNAPGDSLRAQMMVGLRYVWDHPVLRPLALAVALFSFFGSGGNAIFVVLATERFGLSEVEFGLLFIVDGVFAIATSFVVAPLVARYGASNSMRLAVATYVIGSLLSGLTTAASALVVAMVFGGISDPTWNVNSASIRQRLVPSEVFGRMMTAYLVIAWSVRPLGSIAAGLVSEWWGPEWFYVASAVGVGSLLVLAQPMFRAIDDSMGRGSLRGS